MGFMGKGGGKKGGKDKIKIGIGTGKGYQMQGGSVGPPKNRRKSASPFYRRGEHQGSKKKKIKVTKTRKKARRG